MGKEKLVGVQYLRAIAALMVAYYHLVDQIPAFAHTLSFSSVLSSQRLSAGVDIFFVISGFIMYVTGRDLSAGEYAWRRLVRIVPLYWALTLVVCAIAVLDAATLHRTDVTAEYAIKSLLFLPYHNPTQQDLLFPLLAPGWTLNYEMAFYALFALALLLPRYRMRAVCFVLLALTLAGMLRARPEMLSISGFYTSSRLALFAAGITLGWLHGTRRLHISRVLCAALILAGFWGVLTDWTPVESSRWAELASATAIVTGVLAWEQQFGLPRLRIPLLLGDASYSIYLAHLFAFGLVRSIWSHVDGLPWAFATASMMAAVALALVTYRLIERPALRLLSGTRQPQAAAHPVEAASMPLPAVETD